MMDYKYEEKKFLHSRFSRTHEIGNIGIIANFVFPYICHFLLYLYHNMFLNVKLDIRGVRAVHFKVADFIGPVLFQWHNQHEIGNIGILVL